MSVRGWLLWTGSALGSFLLLVGMAVAAHPGRVAALVIVDRVVAPAAVPVPSDPRPKARRATRPTAGLSPLPLGLVLGYFYDPADDPSALQLLRPYASLLSGIIPFWYTVEPNGAIVGATNQTVLRWARQRRWLTFALVTNMAGAAAFDPLLAHGAFEARAIAEMAALVRRYGYSGINLDWEGISPADRARFTAFVGQLARVLHRAHAYLTLSVPAEIADDPQDAWTGAYDYAALGRAADLLILMAYDQHNAVSGPGPVASTAWVRAVLAYAVRVVNPDKIVLGIPGYGYDWSPSGTVALTWYQAEALARQFGANGASGHFVYVEDGQVHRVYFENTATFLAKMYLVTGYGLRGLALWRLGIEDPRIWGYLR